MLRSLSEEAEGVVPSHRKAKFLIRLQLKPPMNGRSGARLLCLSRHFSTPVLLVVGCLELELCEKGKID